MEAVVTGRSSQQIKEIHLGMCLRQRRMILLIGVAGAVKRERIRVFLKNQLKSTLGLIRVLKRIQMEVVVTGVSSQTCQHHHQSVHGAKRILMEVMVPGKSKPALARKMLTRPLGETSQCHRQEIHGTTRRLSRILMHIMIPGEVWQLILGLLLQKMFLGEVLKLLLRSIWMHRMIPGVMWLQRLLHRQIMRGMLLQFPREMRIQKQRSQMLGMAGVLLKPMTPVLMI
jgi:hypothetical protein